ncbi:hypothetical protein V4F39_06460 [Aquincola sp. MAHUQ-54]|uniref:2-oxoglutarate-Fe(II)-dependent oxygenase superfamily protein n=1 Tax=Aquincola agrisoli TaxID=3119538 RepID=A0AAW9QES3_9BURK
MTMRVGEEEGRGFEVVDDLLPPAEFAAVWHSVHQLRYETGGAWNKLWGLASPMPAVSASTSSFDRPLGDGLDGLMGMMEERMRASSLFDRPWAELLALVFLQPRGSRLGAHGDSRYAGSAVFYAHPVWEPDWGGELFFPQMPRQDDGEEPEPLDGPLAEARQRAREASQGTGCFVAARPNRLVLIRHGVWHRTQRVDPDAGAHLRCAVAAFAVPLT